MRNKRVKKLTVLRLSAEEICYLKAALDFYVEETIYNVDVIGFELQDKFKNFISERPKVFPPPIANELSEEEIDDEDSLWG